MKVRFVVIFAIILMVIGIIVTCCDIANTTSSSNEAEMQTSQTETSKETEGTETIETTGELETEETQSTETTETPETESTKVPETTETPETDGMKVPEATEKPESEGSKVPETTEKPESEGANLPETTEKPDTQEPTAGKDEEGAHEEQITFESAYICDDGVMPYALYTPSTIHESENLPLIVWLHGSGEVGSGRETFFNSGLLKTLNKWRRQGFNAYVICPHLTGSYNTGRWNKESTKENLQELLDQIIDEYDIDPECIVIVGHSLGGQGALYMAHELPEYFSRCVVLSGYNPGIDISEIKIPTIGFVGTENAGEDAGSVSYMKRYFMEVFGDENTFFFETSHGGVPSAVFSFDTDDDDKSDLVEWMLSEFEF